MLPNVAEPSAHVSLRSGRYQVVRTLGAGSQGETLEAVDKLNGRLVAIKRFRIRGAPSWKDVELAEREARVLSRLEHPALPAYVEHFEEAGALHLVMDKIDGVSVAQRISNKQGFREEDVMRFLRAASDVLDYLHRQAPPVIHRDLKPGNVVIRPDGSFAFVDFGAVRDTLRPDGGSTVVGTFGYMAPEQFQGRALPASDVYAVGATVLAMLTGVEPEHLPHKGLAIDVKQALRGTATPAFVAVLERMLTPDPDERAARIAPLLMGMPRPGPRVPGEWGDRGDETDRSERRPADASHVSRRRRAQRRGDRKVDKAQRKADRKAEKAQRRADRVRRRAEDPARWHDLWDQSEDFFSPDVRDVGRKVESEVRHAWQEIEREWFRGRGRGHPGRGRYPFRRRPPDSALPLAFATFGISLARVVVWALFRVVAPLALTILSLFFGPSLRRAARAADGLGHRVDGSLRRAQERVESELATSERRTRTRVDVPPERVRVNRNTDAAAEDEFESEVSSPERPGRRHEL